MKTLEKINRVTSAYASTRNYINGKLYADRCSGDYKIADSDYSITFEDYSLKHGGSGRYENKMWRKWWTEVASVAHDLKYITRISRYINIYREYISLVTGGLCERIRCEMESNGHGWENTGGIPDTNSINSTILELLYYSISSSEDDHSKFITAENTEQWSSGGIYIGKKDGKLSITYKYEQY